MKKLIALSLLVASFAVPSAFGQGYFLFTTGKSQVYDGFTTAGTSVLSSKVDVALLWAASGTTATLPVTSTDKTGNSTTVASYTDATAWTDIAAMLSTGGWTEAVNSSTSLSVQTTSASNGGLSYNSGVSFGITGTLASTAYSLILVSWDSTYSTLAAAEAAGAAVGWSSVFSYTSSTSIATPSNMSGLAPAFGTFASVPEPCTMALLGLGGLSLLVIRRRK
jgi:hypothetical protein